MASAETRKLKVNIVVTGFSVPTNPERWVRLRIAASNGRSVERVFSYLGLNNDPRPLIGAASAIGIPLIRSGAKQEFMALVEGALSKADQLAADPPPAFEPVTRVGWHRNVFITPRTFYPYPQNSMELCLGEVRGSLSYQRKGSLRQWKRAFQWSLQRNPYLLFAASLSLAPCLLKFANLEGCIICLVGPTSRGKTTLLDLSGSARGGFPSKKLGFKDSWGTTANALEQLAIQANDTLLILDDIQNVPGSIYQRAALLDYAAFNLPSGREKDRMTQIHAPREWRTIALTSSNRTLADVLERGGMQWDPSHGVRFIEIPINNAFSNVPEGLFPAQFAERLARKNSLGLRGAVALVPGPRRDTGHHHCKGGSVPATDQDRNCSNANASSNSPIRWRDQPSRIIFCAYRNSRPNSGRRWDFASQPARGKRRGRARLDGLQVGSIRRSTGQRYRGAAQLHQSAPPRICRRSSQQAQRRRLACRRPRICHRNGQVGGILFLRHTVQSALPTRLHRETALRLSTA